MSVQNDVLLFFGTRVGFRKIILAKKLALIELHL
jgi:hypothetical protein